MRFASSVKSLLVLGALVTTVVSAQQFPSKPISMVVAYPAGGPSDVVARVVAPHIAKGLGQNIVVENIAGAAGAIGVQKMLSAAPDGHTLLLGSPMELVLTPLSIAAAKYKPEDVQPLVRWGSTSMVLLARKDLPANTVEELVALAKTPGSKEMTFGSLGRGSLYHLVTARFQQLSGTKMLEVPYKGAAPLVQDLIGGQIDIVFMPLAGNVPALIKGGNVKPLGLAAASRHPQLSQIPLIKETKGMDDFVYGLWSGVQVSKNVPVAVQNQIHKAANEALMLPEVRKAIEAQGSTPANTSTLAELTASYAQDIARYQAIAKSINLQPE
jgi:tripartite-type tricarboxylate transporter receptor subunit TctC